MSGAGYGIQAVADRCGVNPVTLRAWERRYGLIKPARTTSGHRRYSDEDVARIRAILGWLDRGLPIGQVRQMLDGEGTAAAPASALDAVPWRTAVDEALVALDTLNSRRLEQLFNRLTGEYPLSRVFALFCDPLLESLRIRPARAGARALLESTLQQKLAGRLLSQAPRRGDGGWLVMAVGDPLGAQMQALLLGPVWCLDQTVVWNGLAALLDPAQVRGVLWRVGERPNRRAAAMLWPARVEAVPPLYIAGPALTSALPTPPGLIRLDGDRERVALTLRAAGNSSSLGESGETDLVP